MSNISDIATLGLDIDSGPLERAAVAGDKFVASSRRVQRATEDMRSASNNSARATESLINTVVKSTRASMAAADASLRAVSATKDAAQATLRETQATQSGITSRRQLEQSIQAVTKAQNLLAASRGRDTQLRNYAARLDEQELTNLRSLTQAQAAYTNALRAYGAAASQARTASQMQTSNNASNFQSSLNSRLGVNTSTGISQSDLEENARAANQLRASIDPLFASSKRYESVLNEINQSAKILNLTEAQTIVLREKARLAFEGEAIAAGKMAGATKLSANALTNLSYQVNDVVSGLAMGQSPFQILAQQGGQFVQIMQMSGTGPMALLKGIGTTITNLITPARLAVGGLLGIAVAIGVAYSSAINNQKQLEAAVAGSGRAAGVTAGQLDSLAKSAANQANVSVGSAREWAEAYAKSGAVVGNSIKDLTAITADYAATTGQSTDDANKDLVAGFKDLSTGIDNFARKLGGISPGQKQYIKDLEASGQHNEAVKAALDAMSPSLINHANQLTMIGRLWENIRNAASGAMSAIMTSAAPNTDQLLADARSRLANAKINSFGTLSTGTTVQSAQAQVDLLEQKQRKEQQQAKSNAATANANNLASGASPLIRGLSGITDKSTLQNQVKLLQDTVNTPGAVGATGMQYDQATAALEAYKGALESYITPAERATKQSQLQARAVSDITPAQKAATAAAQAALSLQGQAIPADEKAAMIKAAYNSTLAEGNHQLAVQNAATQIAIQGNLALADAWLQGSGAAMKVTATTNAKTKALSQAVNTDKEVRDAQIEQISAYVASSAQAANASDNQAKAMKAANDAVDAGTISYSQVSDYAQQYAIVQDLEIQKTNALALANDELATRIDRVIAATKRGFASNDNEKDRATIAATTQDLKDQVKLAGMSTEEREKESAILGLEHSLHHKITEEEKDGIRATVQARQETERMREVVDDVAGSFQDMFIDLLDHGKLSIGKLADSIKSTFIQLLAWMATQAIMQPIIIPMVGSIAGALGIPGMGGISGAVSGGGGGALSMLSGAGNISSLFGGSSGSGMFGSLGSGFSSLSTSLFGSPEVLLGGGEVLGGAGGGSAGLLGSAGLGAVLGGFGVGSLASSLIFGNKNSAGIGGMGGAAAGAILGSIFPGVGTIIGGLAGGLLGGGLGSMTGTSNQGAIANFSSDGSNYLFKQGGGNNGAMATTAANQVSQVIKGLASAGVTVSLGNVSGLSIGSDKSYVYGYNGMKEKLAGGEEGVTAVVKSILQKILPSATGGDENTQRILSKYQQGGGITADNIDQLVSDLGFAKNLANFDFGIKSLTQSQQLLKNISDQFEEAIKKAEELGLDTSSLVNARNSAIQSVVYDYNDAIAMSLEQIVDPIKYAFDQLANAQKQRLEDATGLGADLSQVYALNKAEYDSLVKQFAVTTDSITAHIETVSEAQSALNKAYNAAIQPLRDTISKYQSVVQSLRQFSASIFGSQLGGGSTRQQYAAARAQFSSISALAQSGDPEAMAQLQTVAQNFLTLSAETSQNQEQYAKDVADVKYSVDKSADYGKMQLTAAQQQIDILNAQVDGLGVIDDDVKSVTQAILDLQAAIEAQNQAMNIAISVDGQSGAVTSVTTNNPSTPAMDPSLSGSTTSSGYDVASSSAAALATATGSSYSSNASIYNSVSPLNEYGFDDATFNSLINQANSGDSDPWLQQFNSARQILQQHGVPGFATGGRHSGGWRMVGEQGPELENTGASNIYSNDALNGMFNADGIIEEISRLRSVVEMLLSVVIDGTKMTKRIKDLFDNVTNSSGGNSVKTS